MSINIAILNCYADEPKSAPSAQLIANYTQGTKIVNICFDEEIKNITDYDGYIISGSRSGHKDKEMWISNLRKIIRNIYKEEKPCLAICFGHQVVTHAFRGTTVRNLAGEEGFIDIPTMVGDNKVKLFDGLPNPVKIYQSHKDSVMKPPTGGINVIYNEKCLQYYQFGSIHSLQSHPEISVATATKIAKKNNQEITSTLNGVTDQSFQSNLVLENFYNIVLSSK